MLDVASEEDPFEESIPGEEAVPTGDEPVQHEKARMVLKRRSDALPSPGVNPFEGSPKCSCGKLGL